ncbi:MAG: beta-glucosidase-related glycosidase and D-alanyl-D-alanine dipeptidase [Parachlamydiales bacterium]|nr:beta-glucosidase-related glycosidase and D-alanyl-D-alanine dipeptidase [Parachlamydiales bacterium]
MHGLTEIVQRHPSIILDIRYATKNNFLGRPLYSSARCFLVQATAERLYRVSAALEQCKLGLKVFDGYRPLLVQKKFWSILPDPRYFADPAVGSNHNRGAAVDLTLVDEWGIELLMPSGFDEMTERSHRNYQGGPAQALAHRSILEEAMGQEGFVGCPTEWWHFDDPDWARYPILDIPIEA